MSDNIELKPMGRSAPTPPPRHPETSSLHAAYKAAEEKARAAVHLQEGNLDAVSVWGLAVSAWFAFLAIPLLLFPRLMLFFAQSPSSPHVVAAAREEHYDNFTPLESFLVLVTAIGLLALALTSLLILAPSYQAPSINPSRKPLLGILVGLTTISSLVAFNTGAIGGLGKFVGIGNLLVAVWGWWVVMFGEMKRGERRSKMPDRLKKL